MKKSIQRFTLIGLAACSIASYATSAESASNQTNDYETLPLPSMVSIPAGRFVMGCIPHRDKPEGSCSANELPAREVSIKPFQISETEVTFEQWDACVKAAACNGYSPDDLGMGRGAMPVMMVSWTDAQNYTKWLSRYTGKNYRLPTEAEWEYVARTGKNFAYSWGNTATHEQANYGVEKCCGPHVEDKDQWEKTAPVASFPPNAWGIYDMHGNVKEWVQDCWYGDYKGAPVDGSAREKQNCFTRVLRGGSWVDSPTRIRSGSRDMLSQDMGSWLYGFRVVADE